MSEDEDESFCYFGKPLDSYDDDAFPKKRPITVEEQIATDAQGRRRFHGAFTGGFSAGFFNTVGSLEGWSPSEFKSTRQEKAKTCFQKPEDFMDEEDISEYGIAPQTVRARKDYSTSNKRRKQVFADGPIPGVPVLETLLKSGNETIGYLLLRKIGLKEKIRKQKEELNPTVRNYGCQKPDEFKIPEKIEQKQYKIPEIYNENLTNPKSDTFGLGYKGLDRSHVNLFSSTNLVVRDKNNKAFSIAGQAFGVGAFEEEDDDIYIKEDMSNYDFEMAQEKSNQKDKSVEGNLIFGMFKLSKASKIFKKLYPPPVIPHSFSGKHKVKKSRFEPVEVKNEKEETARNQINPLIRAKYLGEETNEDYTPSQPVVEPKPKVSDVSPRNKAFNISLLLVDKFVSSSQNEDVSILEPVNKSENLHGTQDMREAARMKMFGALTRVTTDWVPCAQLCKKFNVPEPLMGRPEEKNRKRTKNLIFENQKFVEDENKLFKPGCSTTLTPLEITSETSGFVNETNDDLNINLPEKIKTEIMSPDQDEIDEEEKQTSDDSVVKDISEKIGIDDKEKIDLFKAVFLSSSESEDEAEDEEKMDESKKNQDFKETILSDLVPKIRPLRQGILSNITFQPRNVIAKDEFKEANDTETEDSSKPDDYGVDKISNTVDSKSKMTYGPQLPSEKVVVNNLHTVDLKNSDDEWVEKDDLNNKKSRKHKKNKKEKKKHKHSRKDRDD